MPGFLYALGIGYLIDFIRGYNHAVEERNAGVQEYERLKEAEGFISAENRALVDRQIAYDSEGRLGDYLKNEALGFPTAPPTKEETQGNIYESRRKRQ